jgi:phosphoribosylformimino-5-aminoimidazole carboxamide ribotide isomerase
VTDRAGRAPDLYPAIDLRGGRCVRLEQGRADRETSYDADPVQVAEEFARAGARWIHVVDLDAAFGEGSNRELIGRIAAAVPVRVQTGGGLRSEADLTEVLEGPVARAVIGTAAIESPQLVQRAIERFGPGQIAVGLDARGRRPAIRGWRDEIDADLLEIGRRMADLGVRTLIHTDISRDGMFAGPNVELSLELAEASGTEVIVSGGVGSIADIQAVRDLAAPRGGIAGVIVGKAIYEGRIDVAEAVRRLG